MPQEENIRKSVFQHLTMSSDDAYSNDVYDAPVLNFISSALSVLFQNGIGTGSVSILDKPDLTWSEFFTNGESESVISLGKTFVFTKVQLMFDPPSNTASTIIEKYCDELLWRAREEVEYGR